MNNTLLKFTTNTKTYNKAGSIEKNDSVLDIGSVDGVIIDNSNTEHFIEAFNLSSLSKDIIQRHINKVESSYDSKGLFNKFLLVYCNVADNKFDSLYSRYLDFIDNKRTLSNDIVEIYAEKNQSKT